MEWNAPSTDFEHSLSNEMKRRGADTLVLTFTRNGIVVSTTEVRTTDAHATETLKEWSTPNGPQKPLS